MFYSLLLINIFVCCRLVMCGMMQWQLRHSPVKSSTRPNHFHCQCFDLSNVGINPYISLGPTALGMHMDGLIPRSRYLSLTYCHYYWYFYYFPVAKVTI